MRRRSAHGPLGAALALALLASPALAADDDDLSDVLEGFEDSDPRFEVEREDAAPDERRFDLSGSLEISGSYNVVPHRSDTGTYYGGLQRLRNRANLQLDAELPWDWRLRFGGWGFGDAAYVIQGRQRYTSDVRREYEVDADVGEAWLAGEIAPRVDLKVGRQVVAWGRSESLRVLDVLNPLDNREPGRIDLEDLRRTVTMLRLDAYAGDWSLTAVAVPEIRFDLNPVVGSDFFPGVVELPEHKPRQLRDGELAGALTGVFSGWDVSLHGAWFWDDRPRPDGALPTRLVHDRLWLVGAGGNTTAGSWLFKGELAFVDGVAFGGSGERRRLDALLGVEYYGLRNTTLVAEIANRHVFDHEAKLRRAPNFVREETTEIALRLTRSFWRERLRVTLLGIVLGIDARDGSIARADLEYDLADALTASVGVLLYQSGELPPLDGWERNDRIFFGLKWSF